MTNFKFLSLGLFLASTTLHATVLDPVQKSTLNLIKKSFQPSTNQLSTNSLLSTFEFEIDANWIQRNLSYKCDEPIDILYSIEKRGTNKSPIKYISVGMYQGQLKYFNFHLQEENKLFQEQVEAEELGSAPSYLPGFYENKDVESLPRFLEVCEAHDIFSASLGQHILGLIPNLPTQ